MAKNDSYSTRSSAYADDDADDAFLRPAKPAAPSRGKSSRVSKTESVKNSVRERLLDKASENLSRSAEEDEPFLRTRRRVPIRKGFLPLWTQTRLGRIGLAVAGLVVLAGGVALFLSVQHFLNTDPRFRMDSAADVQTVGNSQLSREDLLSVFGEDIGRNIFHVPLAERRKNLEEIPWVQHATVMRILPNELRVSVTERTPIAFVRIGDQVKLADADGVILDMSPAMMAARHFSFPVVTGIKPEDPPAARKARMQLYQNFLAALDSGGQHLSDQMSEIDLSDAEDARATVPAKGTDLQLHFGDEKFLERYQVYQSHIAEWEQQYPTLVSVDLRYDGQVVLKKGNAPAPDASSAPAPADAAVKPDAKPAGAKKHTVVAPRHARRAGR
ncbi:cell division protein FtsQ/DivIB [Silvibacterium sp.]|uniref:cell division protein FtsQ/DivIB n=1 Tax=Silvibacterium sp. TaxID=1964179 RepID=UPI0039E3B93B